MAEPVDVFLSYAPADEGLRVELETHLAGLRRYRVLRTWSDRSVAAGDDWREAVEAHLTGAGIVLLLVSSDYLASDYHHEVELMRSLARARAGRARVIPVLLRACDRTTAAFDGLKLLPPNGKPVTSWPNRDEAWAAVARGIREAITGAAVPVVAPEPAYENVEIRALVARIERARSRKAALAAQGVSTEALEKEILALRRQLREGGQLRAGDALGDGRYLLLHPLGHGGFGAVWTAFDKTLGERVAIKVLHPSQARDASRRERFFRGARVMGSLQHEGVVRVLKPDGEDGGYLFFVMELVAGGDLQHAVIEKRVRPWEAVPLILRVAEALASAHARGIVHRDVKPANVVLDASGRPKLTDFDLVAAKDTTGGTRTGAMGTFLYAAPEQMHNAKEADTRADVYGLGMTAVFCLYGKELPALMPYKRWEIVAGLECADEVKVVVRRAIELEPDRRYEDAQAFSKALRAATFTAPRPPSPSRPLSARPPPVAAGPVTERHQAVARDADKLVPQSVKPSPESLAIPNMIFITLLLIMIVAGHCAGGKP